MIEMSFGDADKLTIHEDMSIEHTFYGKQKTDAESIKARKAIRRKQPEFYGAIESLTSFLLAMHSRGVDIQTPGMVSAIMETLDYIGNEFGED
jgi:hypothetical protein